VARGGARAIETHAVFHHTVAPCHSVARPPLTHWWASLGGRRSVGSVGLVRLMVGLVVGVVGWWAWWAWWRAWWLCVGTLDTCSPTCRTPSPPAGQLDTSTSNKHQGRGGGPPSCKTDSFPLAGVCALRRACRGATRSGANGIDLQLAATHQNNTGAGICHLALLGILQSAQGYASRAVQLRPNGGQFDFVRSSARTPHGHTCSRAGEVMKNTHRKRFAAFFRDQALGRRRTRRRGCRSRSRLPSRRA